MKQTVTHSRRKKALYFISHIIYLIFLCSLASCTGKSGQAASDADTASLAPAPRFCADTAMAYVVTQCDFGPRVPGTPAHETCGDWIKSRFAAAGLQTGQQTGTVRGFDGQTLPCRNIMARTKPDAATRILITAHWDSRAWADNDPDAANHHTPVLAANDGASGVAVMLEIARHLVAEPPAVGIDFVCFDVEDQGHPQWAEDFDSDADETQFWCLGSRLWAEEAFNTGYKARFAINLDMVGGRGARFAIEAYSRRQAASVVDLVWSTAARLGYGNLFPTDIAGYVMDDHVPVAQLAGVPAIDIIPNVDDSRSSFGPTWHTTNDTPDAIDPAVLAAVGQTILQVIYELNL